MKITWEQPRDWSNHPHIREGIEQAVISNLGEDIRAVKIIAGPHKSGSDKKNHITIRLVSGTKHINTPAQLVAQIEAVQATREEGSKKHKPEHQSPKQKKKW